MDFYVFRKFGNNFFWNFWRNFNLYFFEKIFRKLQKVFFWNFRKSLFLPFFELKFSRSRFFDFARQLWCMHTFLWKFEFARQFWCFIWKKDPISIFRSSILVFSELLSFTHNTFLSSLNFSDYCTLKSTQTPNIQKSFVWVTVIRKVCNHQNFKKLSFSWVTVPWEVRENHFFQNLLF